MRTRAAFPIKRFSKYDVIKNIISKVYNIRKLVNFLAFLAFIEERQIVVENGYFPGQW